MPPTQISSPTSIATVPTLPRLLAKRGYVSHQSGKWWQGHYSRGGYTPGWGPHVDATAAAATALAQRAEQKFGSIREAFLSVDTNGNGYVERSELEAVSPAALPCSCSS